MWYSCLEEFFILTLSLVLSLLKLDGNLPVVWSFTEAGRALTESWAMPFVPLHTADSFSASPVSTRTLPCLHRRDQPAQTCSLSTLLRVHAVPFHSRFVASIRPASYCCWRLEGHLSLGSQLRQRRKIGHFIAKLDSVGANFAHFSLCKSDCALSSWECCCRFGDPCPKRFILWEWESLKIEQNRLHFSGSRSDSN